MQAQGWQPGEYLGAKDANHAEHYTIANASHIRVLIKDDNLGIGAKIGSGVGHGECTGLDAFKNLLGRLNGKDEDELEKEQRSREDLKRAIYTERKWGQIRFVKGGFLIGDKIQDLIEGESDRLRKLGDAKDSDTFSSSSEEEDGASAPVEKEKISKKRKANTEEEVPEVVAVQEEKLKKQQNVEPSPKKGSQVDEYPREETDKQRRKRERQEKRDRKQQRRAMKAKLAEESSKDERKKQTKDKKKDAPEPESVPIIAIQGSTPASPIPNLQRSTPMMSGRHAVRSRNIAQKRLASMDVASLNQVCSFPVF